MKLKIRQKDFIPSAMENSTCTSVGTRGVSTVQTERNAKK